MTDPKPTPKDIARAEMWLGLHNRGTVASLALEFARVRAEEREACVQIVQAEVNSYIPLKPDRDESGKAVHVCRSRLVAKIRARGGA